MGFSTPCGEVCGKKRSRRRDEVKEIIARKKAAFKKTCWLLSEGNKIQYKRIRNQTRKVVAKVMRKEAK